MYPNGLLKNGGRRREKGGGGKGRETNAVRWIAVLLVRGIGPSWGAANSGYPEKYMNV